MKMRWLLMSLVVLTASGQFVKPQAVARYGYRVVKALPHDRGAFTQGLEFRDGVFIEGTGMNGRSSLRRVEPTSGKVLQQVPLAEEYFGEGITVIADRIYQLTWKSQLGFIYDRKTFKLIGRFRYPGEGWGFCNDGKNVYMSDGSAEIRVWDGTTLRESRRITVRNQGAPIDQLNELEWVDGEIYANVWQTDMILRISPADGRVLGVINLRGILADADRRGDEDVLNGIAYDAVGKRLFVTGKQWPKIYQIELKQLQ